LRLESRGHIVGIRVFIDSNNSEPDSNSGLRQAAFRAAIREEMHVAFINQQPLTLPAELCNIDRSFSEADDDTWAMRMIIHCRDVLAYSIQSNNTESWDRMVEYHQQWDMAKPESFSPIFYVGVNRQEGRYLPEIWFLHDCHGKCFRAVCLLAKFKVIRMM